MWVRHHCISLLFRLILLSDCALLHSESCTARFHLHHLCISIFSFSLPLSFLMDEKLDILPYGTGMRRGLGTSTVVLFRGLAFFSFLFSFYVLQLLFVSFYIDHCHYIQDQSTPEYRLATPSKKDLLSLPPRFFRTLQVLMQRVREGWSCALLHGSIEGGTFHMARLSVWHFVSSHM